MEPSPRELARCRPLSVIQTQLSRLAGRRGSEAFRPRAVYIPARLRAHPGGRCSALCKAPPPRCAGARRAHLPTHGSVATATTRHEVILDMLIPQCLSFAATPPSWIRRSACSWSLMRPGCSDAYPLLRIESAVTRRTECRTLADHSVTLREWP